MDSVEKVEEKESKQPWLRQALQRAQIRGFSLQRQAHIDTQKDSID